MAATTVSIRTIEVLANDPLPFTVKTAETIFQGALVGQDVNGELTDATAVAAEGPYYVATGDEAADNPAAASKFGGTTEGELTNAIAGTRILVTRGRRWLGNGEAIDDTDVGQLCYIVDNTSVGTTAGGQLPVGTILAVDSVLGVLVDMYNRSAEG